MGFARFSLFCVASGMVLVFSSGSTDMSQEIKPFPKIFMQRTQIPKLVKIPKHFEVRKNARATFGRYIEDIESMAKANNYTIRYKVKVNVIKKDDDKKISKLHKNIKKYVVPLKKQGTRITAFEKILRRIAEEKNTNKKEDEPYSPVTFNSNLIQTTKQPFSGKYKPLPSKLRANFTKHVKPIRNKVITLLS